MRNFDVVANKYYVHWICTSHKQNNIVVAQYFCCKQSTQQRKKLYEFSSEILALFYYLTTYPYGLGYRNVSLNPRITSTKKENIFVFSSYKSFRRTSLPFIRTTLIPVRSAKACECFVAAFINFTLKKNYANL